MLRHIFSYNSRKIHKNRCTCELAMTFAAVMRTQPHFHLTHNHTNTQRNVEIEYQIVRRPIRIVQVLFSKLSTYTIHFCWLPSITCVNFNHIKVLYCTRTKYKHHHRLCTPYIQFEL